MVKRSVHHPDFDDLVEINKEVVALTREPSDYSAADKAKLEALVSEVSQRADNQEFEEAVHEKVSLLVYKLACGQYFKAGNQRTALVAGQAFLRKNGYSIELRNRSLISAVDKAGVAAASLDDLFNVMDGLVAKSPTDRKGWEKVATQIIESNRRFLTDLGS